MNTEGRARVVAGRVAIRVAIMTAAREAVKSMAIIWWGMVGLLVADIVIWVF